MGDDEMSEKQQGVDWYKWWDSQVAAWEKQSQVTLREWIVRTLINRDIAAQPHTSTETRQEARIHINMPFSGRCSHPECWCNVEAETPEQRRLEAGDEKFDNWLRNRETPEQAGGERLVAGRYEGTFAQFTRRAGVLIHEEQAKPLPDNTLIAFLCDSIRMARESVASVTDDRDEAYQRGQRDMAEKAAQVTHGWHKRAMRLLDKITNGVDRATQLTLRSCAEEMDNAIRIQAPVALQKGERMPEGGSLEILVGKLVRAAVQLVILRGDLRMDDGDSFPAMDEATIEECVQDTWNALNGEGTCDDTPSKELTELYADLAARQPDAAPQPKTPPLEEVEAIPKMRNVSGDNTPPNMDRLRELTSKLEALVVPVDGAEFNVHNTAELLEQLRLAHRMVDEQRKVIEELKCTKLNDLLKAALSTPASEKEGGK